MPPLLCSIPQQEQQARIQQQYKQKAEQENNKPQEQPIRRNKVGQQQNNYDDNQWSGLMKKLATIPYQPLLAERIKNQVEIYTDEDFSEMAVALPNKYSIHKRVPLRATE